MTRSASHGGGGGHGHGQHGGGGALGVDWDSWFHEFEHDHEHEHEHQHSWFGEFVDLVFVAVIINFADQLKYETLGECVPENNGLDLECMLVLVLEAALFFLAFFMVWYELSVTLIRFTAIDGILDDLLKFAYLAGIVTMALQLSSDDLLNKNIGGFMTGMIICLLCCTLLHIIYYFNIEHCQLYAQRRIVMYCSCICVLLFVSILGVLKLSLFTVFAVSVLILWISSNSFRVILTPNDEMLELPEEVFEHIVERWGLFVMIATGESILAMVATTDGYDSIAYQHYISILCAFGI